MTTPFLHKKQKMGLLFGIVAGLAFSITAWGVDAWQLVQAHAAFPLIKFIPGLFICGLAGGLVGWLTIRVERVWASLLLWSLLTGLYAWSVLWLPLKSTPALMQYLEPNLSSMLYYPRIDSEIQFGIIVLIVIGFVASICALMEIHLIDQSMLAMGSLSLVSPLLIALVLFGVAGSSGDYMLNRYFREPVQAVDELIQFAVDNEEKDIPPILARQKRLSVVKDLDGLLSHPRHLTLIAFDETMGQMDILVDFDGKWVRCSVIYNQPTICKRIKLDALRYAGKGPSFYFLN